MNEQDQMNALAAQLPIGAHALHGVLSGGQPEPEHVALLAAAHIHTVLDLRLPEEERGYDEAASVAHAGMEYLNIPVGPAGPSTVLSAPRSPVRTTFQLETLPEPA